MEMIIGSEPTQDELFHKAVHEAGHAVVTLMLCPERLVDVTIIPGILGGQPGTLALAYDGLLQMSIIEDPTALTDDDWRIFLTVGLGGVVAEKLVFGKESLGALRDIVTVGNIGRLLAAKRPPPVGWRARLRAFFSTKDPEITAGLERAQQVLARERRLLDAVVEELLLAKTLDRATLLALADRHRVST